IIGCAGIIVLMLGLLLRRRTRLAQVLSAGRRPETRPAPETEPAGAPRSAHDTVVLDASGRGQASDVAAAAAQRSDWQAPPDHTQAPDPDDPGLPEWLRDGQDEDLDTLLAAPDEAEQAHSDHPPDAHSLPSTLFTDDGIHGVAGQEFDPPVARLLGGAIAAAGAER